MNWISNYVRPKINSLFSRREMPENLWAKCDECGQMIFHRELADNLFVCPTCDHHMAITPRLRLTALFDNGNFREIKTPEANADPLQFRDQKKYPDRLKEARRVTGENEAMLVGRGKIGDVDTIVAAQDFSFLAGSMGIAVGNALIAAAEKAVKAKAPLIVFCAAGGARMQEGILSLMQMPRTTVAVEMVKEAGLPFITILTHPTTGGVTASYAMLGDVQIAEPNALICFAGPRVIEQTIGKNCRRNSSGPNIFSITACWIWSSTGGKCGMNWRSFCGFCSPCPLASMVICRHRRRRNLLRKRTKSPSQSPRKRMRNRQKTNRPKRNESIHCEVGCPA